MLFRDPFRSIAQTLLERVLGLPAALELSRFLLSAEVHHGVGKITATGKTTFSGARGLSGGHTLVAQLPAAAGVTGGPDPTGRYCPWAFGRGALGTRFHLFEYAVATGACRTRRLASWRLQLGRGGFAGLGGCAK